MLANFHTHTYRCRHAEGQDEEYVEEAIRQGLKVLGFADHSPYPFPDGYTSGFRMGMEELEGYCDSLVYLKKSYQSQIEIRIGLEAEYYPAYFEQLLEFLKDYPIDYLIQGQHFIHNEIGAYYCGAPTTSDADLEIYCRQAAEGFSTGRFLYLAHPDLIHYQGDPQVYEHWMRWLCIQAREHGIPLEINHLGIWDSRHYPNREFWRIAGEEDCKVILGSDAHKPTDVYRRDAEKIALQIVSENHLTLLSGLELQI